MAPHLCHARRCSIAIPPRLLMCSRHWYMVPKELRDEVWATYSRGQEVRRDPSKEWLRAALACIDWVESYEREHADLS